MPVRNANAFEVASGDPNAVRPGAYSFIRYAEDGAPCGIVHACPCGCGGRSALYFAGVTHPTQRQVWTVAGEWPDVTLEPSIGIKPIDATGRYHWHGYLKDGVFEER